MPSTAGITFGPLPTICTVASFGSVSRALNRFWNNGSSFFAFSVGVTRRPCAVSVSAGAISAGCSSTDLDPTVSRTGPDIAGSA